MSCSFSVVTHSYRSRKLYWRNIKELEQQINALEAKEIISVEPTTPDATTDQNCSKVYYAYYI